MGSLEVEGDQVCLVSNAGMQNEKRYTTSPLTASEICKNKTQKPPIFIKNLGHALNFSQLSARSRAELVSHRPWARPACSRNRSPLAGMCKKAGTTEAPTCQISGRRPPTPPVRAVGRAGAPPQRPPKGLKKACEDRPPKKSSTTAYLPVWAVNSRRPLR